MTRCRSLRFFFFNDTATTEIYTLSLHDALPISMPRTQCSLPPDRLGWQAVRSPDRKSTRLNSSHLGISYAVFCLKKKNYEHQEQGNHPMVMSVPELVSASSMT